MLPLLRLSSFGGQAHSSTRVRSIPRFGFDGDIQPRRRGAEEGSLDLGNGRQGRNTGEDVGLGAAIHAGIDIAYAEHFGRAATSELKLAVRAARADKQSAAFIVNIFRFWQTGILGRDVVSDCSIGIESMRIIW